MRVAIVDSFGTVVNVIELEEGAEYAVAEGHTLVSGGNWPAVASETAPQEPARSFPAGKLIDLLTPSDLVAIETTISGAGATNVALRLLWLRLTTREGRPVPVDSDDFWRGWVALTNSLGEERTNELAEALNIAAAV